MRFPSGIPIAASILSALFAPSIPAAAADLPDAATPDSTALVYIGLGGAPQALERKVEQRLRAALEEKSVGLLPASALPDAERGSARLQEGRAHLEKGIAAYRRLVLKDAVAALTAAEVSFLDVPHLPEAPGLLREGRIHLALSAQAMGKTAEMETIFARIAVCDPEHRLDSRAFPPNVVADYERVRLEVAAGPAAELTLRAQPEGGVSFFVNGRRVPGPVVKVPHGEHLVAAVSGAGAAGKRIVVEGAAAANLRIVPDAGRALAAFRAAARDADDDAASRSLDALSAALKAERIVVWDLRSTGGKIQAPLRLRNASEKSFSRSVTAELGATAAIETPIRVAVSALLVPGSDERRNPVARRKMGHIRRRDGVAGWMWWAAGGLALVAAGGAATALVQPGASAKRDTVAVTVEK